MKLVQLETCPKNIIGIYKIDFPNGKSYIGQSQNIKNRILEHNYRAFHNRKNKDIQLCEYAIKKYGAINYFYILEECLISQLDAKEQKWIKFFDTTNKEKGYNLLDRGNVAGRRGCDNANAAFNQDTIKEVYDLLKNHNELSYEDIANLYNVDKYTIFRINSGISYTQDDIDYPIRKQRYSAFRKNKIKDYFDNPEQLLSLKEDLRHCWWLKIEKDLVKKYNIPVAIIRDINNGRKFADIGSYEYPIRSKRMINQNILTFQQVVDILVLLRTTNISMQNIGKQYGVGRATISNINNGTNYVIPNYLYPARKTLKKKENING